MHDSGFRVVLKHLGHGSTIAEIVRLALKLALPAVLLFAAGLSTEVYWAKAARWCEQIRMNCSSGAWMPLYRFITIAIALALLYRLARQWPSTATRPFPAELAELQHSALNQGTPDGSATALLIQWEASAGREDAESLLRFADDLLDLSGHGLAKEVVRLDRWSAAREVTVVPKDTGQLEPRYLVLTRPLKGESYRAFRPGASCTRLLSFIDTQTLCLATAVRLLELTGYEATSSLVGWISQMIADPRPVRQLALDLADTLFGPEPGRSEPEVRFARFLSAVAQVRPLVAVVPEGRGTEAITFSYVQPIGGIAVNLARVELTPWVATKEWVSRTFALRPSILEIQADRGKKVGRYQLEVEAPVGMYIQDAAGRGEPDKRSAAAGRWFPNMDRELRHEVFSAVSISPDRTHCRWALTNASTLGLNDHRLLVRLAELPWGSRGLAAFLAVFVAVEIWMVGSTTAGSSSQGGVLDLVPYFLTAPGLLLAYFALGRREAWLVSGMAVISMWTSAVLSALATALYVAFASGKLTDLKGQPVFKLGEHQDVFLIGNGLWLMLFVAAAAAAATALMAAVSARTRYQRLIQLGGSSSAERHV